MRTTPPPTEAAMIVVFLLLPCDPGFEGPGPNALVPPLGGGPSLEVHITT